MTAKFQPRYSDGRTFEISGEVQVAPDGTLWTSDGHSLLRLDDAGTVDRVIGRQPSDDTLEEIAALTIDPNGNIYMVNERTSAVHVFDAQGTPLRVCTPLPTDFVAGSNLDLITVDGDENVYFGTGGYERDEYLGFSADGKRLGFTRLGLDSVTETWLYQPGTQQRWVVGYHAIHLVDEDDEVAKLIDKRPNGNWIERISEGAVAPDGSLAVITCPAGWASRPAFINIYDADGEGVRLFPMTEESAMVRMAFTGSTVITAEDGALYLYDVQGGAPKKFVPAFVEAEDWWHIYLSPDGREVWLLTFESLQLLRYKLP